MFIDTFSKHFDSIENPRQTAKISHPFFDIMFVTMCAVIAGADGWKEIQEYAEVIWIGFRITASCLLGLLLTIP